MTSLHGWLSCCSASSRREVALYESDESDPLSKWRDQFLTLLHKTHSSPEAELFKVLAGVFGGAPSVDALDKTYQKNPAIVRHFVPQIG